MQAARNAGLPLANPEELGLIPARLQRAYDLLEKWTRIDKVPAAALCVGRKGKMLPARFLGRQKLDADAALRPDALFLIASITKPVTATAVMLLVERGEVGLDEPVARYVPKFAQNGKEAVTIRHLMTHTSGLPDMLPNNDQLRAAHKPLEAFIDETCKLTLADPPGTRVVYQSMGFAMLAEIVNQVAGTTIKEFLRKEIFTPLGMADTSLGWQPDRKERIVPVRITPEQQKTDWNWNTPYWLGFGAPWGGMVTSPADFARFCQMLLNGGVLGDVRVLSPATVRAMTTNQLAHLPQVPEEDRRCRPWGLGWRLNWQGHPSNYGDLLGPRAFGHSGATGTLCWMDPDTGCFFILFTTQPQADGGRFLPHVSNVVLAALA
jgi:CubicO group peptidase (beta-lactamase class C family)